MITLLLSIPIISNAVIPNLACLVLLRSNQKGNAYADTNLVFKDVAAFFASLFTARMGIAFQIQQIDAREIFQQMLAKAIERHAFKEAVVTDEADDAITSAQAVGRPAEELHISVIKLVLESCLRVVRVGLADALVAKPQLLILDEPTAGLDPNQMREVRDVIKSLGKEHTVLLSTHILSEVEASCDEVIVINKGKLVARGSQEEIQKKRRSAGLSLEVRGDKAETIKVLSATGAFDKVTASVLSPAESIHRVLATWKKGTNDTGPAIEGAVSALVGAGLFVRSVKLETSTLEDVFAELTRTESPATEEEEDA